MANVGKVDYSADFDNLSLKMNDFDNFVRTGEVSYNMLRQVPGLAKGAYQGQLKSTETKGKYADDTYKNNVCVCRDVTNS